MRFCDSDYNNLIGKITMADIAIRLYADGYRQTSSNKAILANNDNVLTECGHALVKAVRKIERQVNI